MSGATQARTGGSVNAAISNAIVKTFHEYLGRGPTKARTLRMDNVVLCLLEDTMTKAERTLASDGHLDTVMQMRKRFQGTMKSQLVGSVEELTGRRVIAFLSDSHADPDISTETFVLERLPEERESANGESPEENRSP